MEYFAKKFVCGYPATKFGACDDIIDITKQLSNYGLKYYIHVDAALYGGIPNNQKNAPIITNIASLGISSISVSLHKYLGVPYVKGVFLALQKPVMEFIPYIGMTDSTTAGSRDIMPFSVRQQIYEVLYLSDENEYNKNILFFENLLVQRGICFLRSCNGNIFVIDKPVDEICNKYQLSTFSIAEKCGTEIVKAHIIIFPFHSESAMYELVDDLCK